MFGSSKRALRQQNIGVVDYASEKITPRDTFCSAHQPIALAPFLNTKLVFFIVSVHNFPEERRTTLSRRKIRNVLPCTQ